MMVFLIVSIFCGIAPNILWWKFRDNFENFLEFLNYSIFSMNILIYFSLQDSLFSKNTFSSEKLGAWFNYATFSNNILRGSPRGVTKLLVNYYIIVFPL